MANFWEKIGMATCRRTRAFFGALLMCGVPTKLSVFKLGYLGKGMRKFIKLAMGSFGVLVVSVFATTNTWAATCLQASLSDGTYVGEMVDHTCCDALGTPRYYRAGITTEIVSVTSCSTCKGLAALTTYDINGLVNYNGAACEVYNVHSCTNPECDNCTSTSWAPYSTGYERMQTATCECGSCTKKYAYRCAAGYYGLPLGSASGCTKCNEPFTTSCNVSNGTGSQTCYKTSSPAGSGSSSACTGTANCSSCCATSCSSGYHVSNCACVANATTSTITFRARNYTMTQDCTSGQSVTLKSRNLISSPVFTNDGWSFDGWATAAGPTTAVYDDGETITCPNSDTTLYGVWSRTVDLYYYGSASATSLSNTERTQYYRNTSATEASPTSVTSVPLYPNSTYGWAPLGWRYDSAPASATATQTGTSTISLTPPADGEAAAYAVYWRTPQIAYDANGGEDSMSNSNCNSVQYYNAGGNATTDIECTLQDNGFPARSGYDFNGWRMGSPSGTHYDEGEEVTFPYSSWDSSKTYTAYADWVSTGVTITIDKNGGTGSLSIVSVSGETPTVSTNSGTNDATVTCTPGAVFRVSGVSKSNATYDGLSTSSSGSGNSTITCPSSSGSTYYMIWSCDAGYYYSSGTCTACAKGTYKASAGNATSCTTASNKYYVNTTAATSETQCPSGYRDGSDSGRDAITDCYKTVTRGCTQQCINPDSTGCYGATCSGSCSCAGGTYKQYTNSAGTGNGSTSGTTSNETCPKTVSSLTANDNYYVNGTTSCPACSSQDGGAYPYSDGGNYDYNYCYRDCVASDVPGAASVKSGGKRYSDNSGNTCEAASCSSGYFYTSSSGTCTPCSTVNNTTTTRSGTDTTSTSTCPDGTTTKAHATATSQTYTQTCNGKYTGGAGGTSGSSACTGCSSYGTTKTYGTCVATACATGYSVSSGACVANTNTITLGKNGGTGTVRTTTSYTGTTAGSMTCTTGTTNVQLPTWQATVNNSSTYNYKTNITYGTKVFLGWSTDSNCTSSSCATTTITCPNPSTTYYAVWGSCTCGTDSNATCAVQNTSNNTCQYKHTCTTGYYHASNGATITNSSLTCTQCQAGAYCAAGATEETPCSDGTYSAAGATSCSNCTTGYTNSGTTAAAHANASSCKATVTLNKNGGSGTIQGTAGTGDASITCSQGVSCNFGSASSLTKDGYTFAGGWGTSSSCSTTTTKSFTNPTGTYYACKKANTNTITLNANGGTGKIRTTLAATSITTTSQTKTFTCTTDSAMTLPTWVSATTPTTDYTAHLTKAKKVFLGWSTDSSCDNATCVTTTATCPTGNTTYYAVWGTPVCNINNGTGTVSTTSSSNQPGCSVTCTAGYGTSGTQYGTAGQVNVNYTCTGNTITLTWANGGHGTAPTTPASCTYGGTFTAASAITGVTGYTFNKWSVNNKTFSAGATVNCTNADLGVTSGTATLTATWTGTTNTITLKKNGGTGTVRTTSNYTSTTDATMTCTSGTTNVALPTWVSSPGTTNYRTNITKSGAIFLGWSTSNTCTSSSCAFTSITCPTGNTTYYAVWGTPVCNINNGTGTVYTGSMTAATGLNRPRCTVTCSSGYNDAFSTGAQYGTAGQVNVNYTCAANTITLSWNNGGHGTAPTTPASCTYGGTFTAASAITGVTGYTFNKWSVNSKTFSAGATVNCTNADLGVYTGTATLTATWTGTTNTITLNGNGADGGKIRNTAMSSGVVTFTCTTGSTISLPTWSATDSTSTTSIYKGKKRFLGWSTSSTATAAETITTCPNGAQTYYAVWSSDCTCGTDSNATCAVQNTSNNTCQYKHTCTTGYYHASNGATITNSSLTCTQCQAGTYCPDGATSESSCPTNWTSAAGASAQTQCYRNITLNKNGGSGKLTAANTTNTIGATTGTNTDTVKCYYNTACAFPSASGLVPTAGGYKMAGGWGTANSCTASTTSFTLTDTAATVTYYACKSTCSYTNSTAATPSSNVCAGTCKTGYSTSGGSNTGTAASCSGTTCTCSPKTFTVTLNDNTGSGGSGTIYTTYNTNVYKDSGRSNAMTSSAYPVTKPSKPSGYKFLGYYNSSNGTTQYIDENGYITSAGLSAGKALTANGTWYARYESMSVGIPIAVSHTYDGTAKSCDGGIEVEEPASGATVTYSETSGGTYSTTVPTITNPGEKTIYLKVSAPGYTDLYESFPCTMNRLTLTPTSGTITYPTTTTTFTAACASGGPVTVSSRNTGVATVSKSSTPTNGAYTVTVTWVAAGSGNNNASTVIDVNCTEQYESEGDEEIESIYAPVSGTYSVTTAKGNGSTTLSSTSSTLTYNGTGTTNTFTAKCADGVKPTATSSNTNAATVAVSSSADANGNYTITNTWVGAGSGDNNATSTITVSCAAGAHYKSSSATHTLTTAKKANTLTLSASSGTVTYPEASKTFTVSTNTSSGTLSISSNSDSTVATASLSGTTVTMTPKKSGSTTITVASAATDYYKSATATYNLTVADKTIVLKKNGGTGTCGGASSTNDGSMTCTYADNTCTVPSWHSTSCNITNGSGSSAKVFIGWDSSSSATTATYAGGTNVKNATSPLYAIWKAPTCSKGTGVNTTSLNSVSNNAPVCNRSSTDGYYCSATQTGTAGSLNVNVTCTAASDGYFAKAGATAQTACAVGSYSTASSASSTCTVCPAGKTTSGTSTHYNANANTACATTCSNASGVTQWLTPRWERNNTVISLCKWGCHAVTMQEPSGNFTDNNYVPQTVYFINDGYNGYSYDSEYNYVPVYADSACSVPLNATDLTIYDHLLPGVEISGVTNNYICSSGPYGSFVTSNPLTLYNYTCTSEAIKNGWVLRYTTSCTNGYEYDENLEACEGYKQSEELYPNEGTGGSSTLYFKYGTGAYLDEDYTMLMSTSANPITIPTRTGYHFDGYYLQGEYVNAYDEHFNYWDDEEPQIINENGYITSDGIEFAQNFLGNFGMGIYARWTANTNTITLNGNSAAGGKIRNTAMTSGAVTFTCTTDSSITLPTWSATDSATTTSIYKGKKRFLGWATSSTATAAETITTCPTGAQTYYAVWSADCTCGTDSNATCAVQNTSNNTCQYKHTCTTGYYHASNGATITNSSLTCTVCPAGSFCPAGATESTLCAAGSYTDTTGQSACTACQNGVTNAGTSASTQQSCGTTCSNAANARTDNNSLTWQTATWTNNSVTNACTLKNTGCKGTYYYNNNNCTACPNATTYKRTTFPENYYATQIDSTSVQNTAGVTAITGCKVLSWISGPRGDLYEYALYNSTTSKYDNTQSYNWRSATAGYYLTDKNGSATTCSSNYRYYHTNSPCPAGSYCPGVPKQACTSANPLPYTATLGLNDCATDTTNYPDSAALSSMIGQCYLTTTSTKYVAEAGAGEVTCACGGYCPGGTVVYYNSDGGTTTGGRTACGSGKYNASTGSSASSACSTAGAGYYANSSCNQTAVNAGYYSSGGGTSATPTAAGNGCLSGNTCGSVSAGYYSSGGGTSATPTAAGNGCISGKSCGKVSAGYYSTGGGTSATPTAAGNGCISTKECGFIAAGYYGGTGATTSSGTAAVNGGYYSTGGGTSAAPTANGNGCVGTGNTCGKLAAAYYCAGGAKVAAPSSTSDSVTGAACGTCNSNYRANTSTGKTAVTQCQINCADGKYVASANGTCSGTCAAGSFKASHNVNYGSTSSCEVCAANTWSNASAASCTACTTAKGYGNSGSNVTNHAGIASCKVTCPGGQYVAAQAGGCVNVGAGNWCAGGTVAENATLSRTACSTGLTTIGYGAGADEAGDCGHKFHAGDGILYLRSTKKTNPSLNVKVGSTTFYGNMSTTEKNMSDGTTKKLKVKNSGTTYWVHDDSVN